MFRLLSRSALVCSAALLSVSAFAGDSDQSISTSVIDAKGNAIGTAELLQVKKGVLLTANLRDLPAGEHGFHLHETGSCKTPDFKSAGSHLNPGEKEHGLNIKGGHHLGDLPNLHVAADGTAKVEVFLHHQRLWPKAEHSHGDKADKKHHHHKQHGTPLIDEDGLAIMVHDKADDYVDMASSGARIACGEFTAQ